MKAKQLIKLTGALAWCSTLVLGMLGTRILYTQSISFSFLVWNLFLAWLPYIASLFIVYGDQIIQNKRLRFLVIIGFSIIWLLSLPNAPYIITDIMHIASIGGTSGAPLWFDGLVVASYGFLGLLLGISSLFLLRQVIQQYLKPIWIWLGTITILFMASFGIYLGRILRWNSWDAIRSPSGLLRDVGDRIINPLSHPRTLVFTLSYAACLISFYLIIHYMVELKENK